MSDEAAGPDVLGVLWRQVEVRSLPMVATALARESYVMPAFRDWAIGLDSNVLLNMAKGRRAADVVDYLAQKHEGPLVLPGQVLQEFWNNRIYAVSGVAEQVRQRFVDLENAVKGIDSSFDTLSKGIETLLADFKETYGHVLDETMTREISTLLNVLQEKAIQSECDRSILGDLAAQRKRAKTPPGFKDEGDGDFLVWVDFLFGLKQAYVAGVGFSAAVLVTDDVKKDWSTKGTTNPILQAEVQALFGVPFQTITLKKFLELVAQEMAQG